MNTAKKVTYASIGAGIGMALGAPGGPKVATFLGKLGAKIGVKLAERE